MVRTIGDKILWSLFFPPLQKKKKYVPNPSINVKSTFMTISNFDFSLVKTMTPSTVQKFRIVSPASKGMSMSQIALWKPFQYFLIFLLGISHSVVNFSVFNILQ
jgi:hypothetical protein